MVKLLKNKSFKRAVCLLTVCLMLSCLPGCAESAETGVRFTKEADFSGATIATITGAKLDDSLSEVVENVNCRYYDETSTMVEALRKGEVDGLVSEDLTCQIITRRQKNLVSVPLSAGHEEYAYILKKNSEYTDDINHIIQDLFDDGTVDRLKNKWIYGDESQWFIDYSQYDLADRGNGVLRVNCAPDVEPMCYVGGAQGQLQGFEIELLYIVADKMDKGLEIKRSIFSAVLPAIESGKDDIGISCIAVSAERRETFDFSLPYYEGGLSVVCREQDVDWEDPDLVFGTSTSSPRFSSLEDFSGATLGTLAGTNFDVITDEVIDGIQYRRYDDVSSMIAALQKGDVAALLMDEPYARLISASVEDLTIFPDVIARYDYGVILRKNSPYTEAYNQALHSLAEDGTLEMLQNKWFSGDESVRFIDYSQYDLEDRGNGVLRAVCAPEIAPLDYVGGDSLRLQGYEIEVLYRIADIMDKGLEITQNKFSGVLPSVESGKSDVGLGCITITEERKESFDFSDPIYTGGLILLCQRKDIIPAGGDIDLNSPGVTIAVEPTTTMEKAVLSCYPQAELMYINSFMEGILAVSTGKADVVAANLDHYKALQNEKSTNFRLHSDGVVGDVGEIAVGISPKTNIPNAKDLVDAFITEVSADGTLDEMKQRWVYDADYTMPEIQRAENPAFKIIFGTTGLCTPFSFYQDNVLAGFDVELMQRFALWCNAAYEIEVYDWNGILPACISGRVDYVFTNLNVTEERRETVDFSIPYQLVKTVMVLSNAETSKLNHLLENLSASFEKTFIRENRWKLILNGFFVTLKIAFLSGIFGTVLGFGFCMLTRSKNKFVSSLSKGFSYVVTGIPSLVVLMLIYFVVFVSVDIDPVLVGVIAFSLMFMLSVSGLLNTGINAVDVGQSEAAAALGFGKAGTFFRIVLPQAVRQVMPLYKGEFGGMLRATSIVGYISIEDLTKASDIIRSRTYEAFFPLISTAMIYFVISSAVGALLGLVERKTDPYLRPRRLPKGVVERSSIPYASSTQKNVEQEELIRIEHLKKAFPDATPLKDVCTSIRRGDVITVIGPSGTGKSTLLRCINRLETPTEGSIYVFGEDVCRKKAELNAVRRRMGMVFQSFNLFNHLTVIENIMLAPTVLKKQPPQEAYEHAIQLLQSVGLGDKALRYPDELSGGQRQRVAIARALAMNPEILLLDEPTSALDPTMVGEVLAVIRRLAAEGMTMIIVTHEMKFARDVSNRIFYMDQGVVYEDGTPDEIFDAPKRNRTRVFVQKLKVLDLEIANDKYDFIGVNEQLRRFAEKHYLPPERIESMQRAFEELCAQNIVPNKEADKPLTVLVEYSDVEKSVDMRFIWKGASYNPMEEGDELSIRLIKHFLQGFWYRYEEGQNQLKVSF